MNRRFGRGGLRGLVRAVGFVWGVAGVGAAGVWSQTDPAPITIDYPYNPDADENGNIGTEDLLELLAVFATEFAPASMTVDGMTLEAYLVVLSNQIAALQATLASGSGGSGGSWGVVDVTVNSDNTLTFLFADGTTLATPILVGPAGPPGPAGAQGPQGPQGPSGGPLPTGLGPYPGEVAMWDGTQWVIRRMYGCPTPGSCNYMGDWDYQGLADLQSCVFPNDAGICPLGPCDDGNSLTYNDIYDADGLNCNGTYCNGACAGLPCDDGIATTFLDAWDADGSVCAGSPCTGDGVDCTGAGPCAGVPYVLFDAKAYALVEIGTQCWFKENLASDSYRNGDPIPGNLTDALWTNALIGAQAIWGVTNSWTDAGNTLATYGRLYNFFAVSDSRGLCPTGYHVPSDEEWTVLENHLGGYSVVGTALKSSPSDTPAWDGDNSSGFSALPGGARSNDYGGFGDQGDGGYWWSSSPYGTNAWTRGLYSGNSVVLRSYYSARFGFSVRCVRD